MTTEQRNALETQLNRVGDWYPNDTGYDHRMSGETIEIKIGSWDYKNAITEEHLFGLAFYDLITLATKMADEAELHFPA